MGIGKTKFNSSVCVFENEDNFEILLTERLSRKKASGAWPEQALQIVKNNNDLTSVEICENRDVDDTLETEQSFNKMFPFFEFLASKNLEQFSRHTNPQIEFITHHMAHAFAAAIFSPFVKCLILVIDGAGSRSTLFPKNHPEYKYLPDKKDRAYETAEERSVYKFNNGQVTCIAKKWQIFNKSTEHPLHYFSGGLGTLYEKTAEYIFNSKRAAGKVMGLAPLADKFTEILDSEKFLNTLDWKIAYSKNDKSTWENSEHLAHYKHVALSVQNYFEQNLLNELKSLRKQYPDYTNLIITGGCALNCTTNMKILDQNVFDRVFVPPNPGDECIGLGAAYYKYKSKNLNWKPRSFEKQHGFYGTKKDNIDANKLEDIFFGYEIIKPESISDYCAQLILDQKVIGWYQGRSECGPRALGHRSILARPDLPGIKDYLNLKIKFREQFRPYGCSVLKNKAHHYFEIPPEFENPFMSFAVKVKNDYRTQLSEVMHVDKTSRMQMVEQFQNENFYNLIQKFGDMSGLYCLLNTSLNVMGEPIVESLVDAKNFLMNVPVDGIAINDYYIRRKK